MVGQLIQPEIGQDLLRADINYDDNESILLDRNGNEIVEKEWNSDKVRRACHGS